ncbi:unnamed protein product [Prunus armeniaca]
MNKGNVVSHYVDDLEGHDRIKSALAHIGTHALLKMLAPDNIYIPLMLLAMHLCLCLNLISIPTEYSRR